MGDYALYLESGPRRKKTMVHVLDLLGCVATGATTEEALDATPDAIRAYLAFLRRHGERVNPDAPVRMHVAEHVTEGMWLGQGSPYLVFAPDLEPISEQELKTHLRRFHWMREALAEWAGSRTATQLDAAPRDGGRTGRAVLLHVLGGPGGYLSAALGGSKGFSAVASAAARGEIALPDALRRIDAMAAARVRAATREERSAVVRRPNDVRTLRKALRRMLEHDWEHLAELGRRRGGPLAGG
ncbi:MAG: type II toxin-antitoxin system HicB family antitoxin [Chloroflexota bacterium]|nr:type II toxin-antitoxin system HicB family antitoxin [Chloroflexota bacterium]